MADAGTLLANRYRLRERLTAGGIADEWRAADLPLGREVAVRLLRTEHTGCAARFLAAARRAIRVIHPGIVRVHDYGQSEPEGIPFLVTEPVGASSLATLTQAGPLDPPWVLEVVWQVAAALEAAHAAGLVHGSVTAANIVLVPGGAVKLTDFGMSDAAEPGTGTPAGDLCSLGMVAWECLTGAPYPAVRALPAVVPLGLAALVASLTDADPRARPATAAEVARRSRELLADHKIVDHYAPGGSLLPTVTASSREATPDPGGAPSRPLRICNLLTRVTAWLAAAAGKSCSSRPSSLERCGDPWAVRFRLASRAPAQAHLSLAAGGGAGGSWPGARQAWRW